MKKLTSHMQQPCSKAKNRKLLPTVLAAAIGACFSLAVLPAVAETTESTDSKTVMTFSGGGYHALTGASSWMMGLMRREGTPATKTSLAKPASLATVTSNVDAIGSNSGGSWFMSLAAHSPTFLKDLTAGATTPSNFTSDAGYMGQAWKLLDDKSECTWLTYALCTQVRGVFKEAGFLGLGNLLLSGDGRWQTSIENDVFFKQVTDAKFPYYSEVSGKALSDPKQPWATDKDWIMAGTFLTQRPSLTYTEKNLAFLGVQTLEGSNSFWNKPPIPGGVPVMMSGKTGTNFLPTGDLNLTYSSPADTSVSYSTQVKNTEMNAAINGMKVIDAAGISSAAGGGFIDMPNLIAKFGDKAGTQLATTLNGFAPAYQLEGKPKGSSSVGPMMSYVKSVHDKFNTDSIPDLTFALKANKVVRMADGGFMDNTAVAQMLRHLQDENTTDPTNKTVPDGFNIVAFDDFPDTQTKWSDLKSTPMPTGNDIASLFGFVGCDSVIDGIGKNCHIRKSGQITHTSGLFGFKFTGVSPQVFACDGYFENKDQKGCTKPDTSKLMWKAEGKEKIDCGDIGVQQPLTYAKYDVTVRDELPGSKLWGLKTPASGSTGTLHVFSILGKGAPVVPSNGTDMTCYTHMVEKIVENVAAKASDKGLKCDTSMPRDKKKGNHCTLGDYLEAAIN